MTTKHPHKNRPTKTGPWTAKELRILRDHGSLGAPAVAELLDRTINSVKTQARTHRISLRRTGETRGLLIGQPRGVTLADLPELLQAAGDTDVALADVIARANNAAHNPTQPICPQCSQRPANHPTSGWCVTCYLKGLAAAHRAAKSEATARREHDATRQERRRDGRSTPRQPRHTTNLDDLDGPTWE